MGMLNKFDKGQQKKGRREKWQGGEDVEKLCSVLTGFLTSPMNNPVESTYDVNEPEKGGKIIDGWRFYNLN